jgi:hypothetical protein
LRHFWVRFRLVLGCVGLSWACLRSVFGCLGPSWVDLKARLFHIFEYVMGRPGLVLGCPRPVFGRPGSVLGESCPVRVHLGFVLRCPGRVLRQSWDRLGCLGPVCGLSWVVLGFTWAVLGLHVWVRLGLVSRRLRPVLGGLGIVLAVLGRSWRLEKNFGRLFHVFKAF